MKTSFKASVSRASMCACFAAAAVAWAAPAAAQDDQPAAGNDGLVEIMVTAQKRSENLQDIPIAISAVTSDALQKSGISDTTTLATKVPGLSVSLGSGYFQPRIRGIGTTSVGPGIENPVALYVDNVYYFSQVMGLTDLSDVTSVAVLKGPQGTLFGRNATGGVIQITTREPTEEAELDFRTSFDTYETSRTSLFAGGGNDIVKGSLSLSYTTQGQGWGRNVANGDYIHKIDDEITTRGKIIVTPNDRATIKLSADYKYSVNSMGTNLRPFPGTTPLLPSRAEGLYDVDHFRTSNSESRVSGVSGTIDYDLDFARAVSITAYRDYFYYLIVNPFATAVPSLDLDVKQRGRQFTQEFQLVSPSSSPVKWVAGLYYFFGTEDLPEYTTNLRGAFATPGVIDRIETYSKTTNRSYAAFAQMTIPLFSEDINLTLGGRYTIEKRRFEGRSDNFFGDTLSPPFVPSTVIPEQRREEKKPTWRIALDHKLTPDILAYVSYNRGFKSGGFNPFVIDAPDYNSEQLDAYEGGLKTELFDRNVRLNVSGFYYDYKNIQVSRYTTTTIVYNGAAAEAYGLDLDLAAQLADGLTFTGGFAYNHSKFKDFPSAPFGVFLPGGGAFIEYRSAKGNALPFAPRYTINAALDYEMDLGEGKLNLNATNFWSSKYYGEPNNQLAQKDYDLLNVSATWTSPNGRYSIGVFGRNLFNEQAFGYANIAPGAGAQVDYTNQPRTFGANFRLKIGS
ncbi:MAG TPA: TonB-dependent receptor [Sphingobium sp.]|nr:TonB-dependent receptor [Sphingobium sp.]